MKAIIYRRYGGPDVLEFTDVADPKVHVDSVLVRVKAAAVNPADLAMRAGLVDAAVPTYFPVIPGWDIAGIVEHAGPATTGFTPGDEVIGYVRNEVSYLHGGYAELVATTDRALAPKPAHLSWAQAAALPLTGLTAYRAVTQVLEVADTDTLLVHGAAGGVGSAAVQIAADRGATVIGVDSRSRSTYLRSIGAEPVESGETAHRAVRALAPQGVDAVLDTVGRGAVAASTDLGHPATRFASIVDFEHPATRPVFVTNIAVDLKEVARLAELGRLTPDVGVVMPLTEAEEAHRLAATRHGRGRIVLSVAD